MSKLLKLTLSTFALHSVVNTFLSVRAEEEDDLDKEDSADDTAKPAEVASKVVTVTDATLKPLLEQANKDGKAVFIKFYAPWCGHCKRMSPDWDSLAEDMAKDEKNCIVAKLDATSEDARESGGEFGIRGFPTLKMVKDDRMYEYEGRRDLESMKEFCMGSFANHSSEPVPWKANFVDKAKKLLIEYGEKAGQVQAFEPTLLPLTFIIGAGIGLMLGMAVVIFTTGGGSEVVESSSKGESKSKGEKKEVKEEKKDK